MALALTGIYPNPLEMAVTKFVEICPRDTVLVTRHFDDLLALCADPGIARHICSPVVSSSPEFQEPDSSVLHYFDLCLTGSQGLCWSYVKGHVGIQRETVKSVVRVPLSNALRPHHVCIR